MSTILVPREVMKGTSCWDTMVTFLARSSSEAIFQALGDVGRLPWMSRPDAPLSAVCTPVLATGLQTGELVLCLEV